LQRFDVAQSDGVWRARASGGWPGAGCDDGRTGPGDALADLLSCGEALIATGRGNPGFAPLRAEAALVPRSDFRGQAEHQIAELPTDRWTAGPLMG
jgi:hypothetical protein